MVLFADVLNACVTVGLASQEGAGQGSSKREACSETVSQKGKHEGKAGNCVTTRLLQHRKVSQCGLYTIKNAAVTSTGVARTAISMNTSGHRSDIGLA